MTALHLSDEPCVNEECDLGFNHRRHDMTTTGSVINVNVDGSYDQALENVAKAIVETCLKRHRAYGHNLLRHGERGILIRIDDKTERLNNLLDHGAWEVEETVSDTWIDIAGYAIQAIMMRTGTFQLPMRDA